MAVWWLGEHCGRDSAEVDESLHPLDTPSYLVAVIKEEEEEGNRTFTKNSGQDPMALRGLIGFLHRRNKHGCFTVLDGQKDIYIPPLFFLSVFNDELFR